MDFSTAAYEGRSAGLETVGLATQGEYLRRLGMGSWIQAVRTLPMGQQEIQANTMAMRHLVDPSGLGDFKVLVQEKSTGIGDIEALMPDPMMSSAPLRFSAASTCLSWRGDMPTRRGSLPGRI